MAVPFVDTNIIPDRNAGVGSLLWDLLNPCDPDRNGPPLLHASFALIDVGVSRARVATALRTLLAGDLGMDVEYVATERLEAVPYANVTLLEEKAETIRRYLSAMISSGEAAREVREWHYVVDREGKVSSLAYRYALHGNEVWEAYFLGRPFMCSGAPVAFADPTLDELLAPDVSRIEAMVEREMKPGGAPSAPGPRWDGYSVEKNPLEAGLAPFGIALQATDVPRRIGGRQNVLFLGNVLNHRPPAEQVRELDRIATNMEEGDLVIVQTDESESASLDVLRVTGPGARRRRERVRWMDTRTLELRERDRDRGSWRRILVKPEVERLIALHAERLATECIARGPSRREHQALVRRCVSQVFATFFRAWPVEATLRVAVREAQGRIASEAVTGDRKGDDEDTAGNSRQATTSTLAVPAQPQR